MCHVGKGDDDNIGLMDKAFVAMYDIKPLEIKMNQGIKDGKIDRKGTLQQRLEQALKNDILSEKEIEHIVSADKLRSKAIQVDHFSHDFSEVRTHCSKKCHLNSVA